jgi:iron transport multicopper oxidase
LDESNLHALGSTSVPGNHTLGEADVNLFLDIDFIPPNTLTVNGAKFVPPTAPVLLQILSGTKTAQDLLPPGSVYVLPRNAVIEVTIPGGSGGAPVSKIWISQVTVNNGYFC